MHPARLSAGSSWTVDASWTAEKVTPYLKETNFGAIRPLFTLATRQNDPGQPLHCSSTHPQQRSDSLLLMSPIVLSCYLLCYSHSRYLRTLRQLHDALS